jgi:Putative adhesin
MTRALLFTMMIAATAPAAQQAPAGDDWCRNENWGRERAGFCEVRDFTMAASGGVIQVDASPNGGIRVEGGPRGDILVQARVVGTADTESRAREIAKAVQVSAGGNTVDASGPRTQDREGWHVSYRLFTPTQASLNLRTVNGGISVTDVEGQLEIRTTNGGVKLARVAGDVRGRTTNGGVTVDLDGATWRGEGLDVQTQNGGVKLNIPADYSARLETGTVNGRIRVDFPVTVQGRIDRDLETTLGAGGPLVRVRTTNGGVNIARK